MDRFQQILTKYWGYSSFRPMQEEIIRSVASGKDTLGLMPTGGGKSITFQVPALAKEGICIVVTPLIALMKDQVENLLHKNIKAVAIYSGMTSREIDITLDNCIYGNYKFLYVSPERLGTDIFKHRVLKMNVNLIAVDEAHCISQWGYDFRPSYLQIHELRELLPDVPALALTATATRQVLDDIQEKLKFPRKNVFTLSFERKNLVYAVKNTEDKLKSLIKIISRVKGTGIIYVRNRKKTKEIAVFLQKNNISADHYHAGLQNETRSLKQEAWKKGQVRIIVSTNAFGMGIDKPDVRFVIHVDLPDNLESYYQEAGRGGRDGEKSYAVILFHESDRVNLEKRAATTFPEIKTIKAVYNALGNFFQVPVGGGKFQSYDFILDKFCKAYKFNMITVYNCMKFLEREGYIELSDDINKPSRVLFTVERDDLYKFQVANERFDGFIRLLLRSYTGLFTEYVNIDENALSARGGISLDTVYQFLNKLDTHDIISYIPRKKNPVVTYTEERLDDKSLRISASHYQERKVQYLDKLHAVLNYASSDNKCRSQLLLSYFGEKDASRCGQCDVCLRRNELELSKYEFDLILGRIREAVTGKTSTLDDLVDNLSGNIPEEKILKVLQWLLDNGKLNYNDQRQLFWKIK
ncbi:MAG: ATP-dependent DNA helicase RecQ [Bacteroidales bacterium]